MLRRENVKFMRRWRSTIRRSARRAIQWSASERALTTPPPPPPMSTAQVQGGVLPCSVETAVPLVRGGAPHVQSPGSALAVAPCLPARCACIAVQQRGKNCGASSCQLAASGAHQHHRRASHESGFRGLQGGVWTAATFPECLRHDISRSTNRPAVSVSHLQAPSTCSACCSTCCCRKLIRCCIS